MKAMLLAAGRGERLRPLTDTTAKPLLSANGVSLIDYHLKKLSPAGIRDVVINTCWQASKIVEHIGNGSHYGLNVVYSHEQQALETAGGVAHARDLLGDNPFLLIS
ncbi:MAG: sugar phosphate nucleotidyltransferase, partial [Pseudomonadota bacterium]